MKSPKCAVDDNHPTTPPRLRHTPPLSTLPPSLPPALSLSLSLSLQTKACSEASRQPQRLITNHSPMGRPVGDASPTTLGANQVVSKEKLGANQVLTPFVGKTYRERERERAPRC